MGFDIILAEFMGGNTVIALLVFIISSFFKEKNNKIISAICMLVIFYFGRYGGDADYTVRNLHIEDILAAEILSWFIIVGGIFLIRGIFKSIKMANNVYIEPLQKKHKDTREEYRKYLINCDKKGKHPLSYNQWKFAYNDKNRTTVHVLKNQQKKTATANPQKTYGWQSWE